MHRYVARANIDHYVEILKDMSLSTQRRSTTIKVSASRQQVAQAAARRDSLALGTSARENAERYLIHLENVHTVLDDFCHRLRHRIASGPA